MCGAVTHTLGHLVVNQGLGQSLLDQASTRGAILKIVNGFLNGETAAIVFFVISGVVIGRSLDRRQESGKATDDFIPFMIRRALRLYPADIAATLGQLSYWWVEMPSVALGRVLARQWTRFAKAGRPSTPAAVAKGA